MVKTVFLTDLEDKKRLYPLAQTGKIGFLHHEIFKYRNFIVAYNEQDEVVGVVSLVMDSLRIPGALGVSFISVHEDHQGKGIAQVLVTALFELATKLRKDIANTSYEPIGRVRLRHVMQRTAESYPRVQLFERDRELEPA